MTIERLDDPNDERVAAFRELSRPRNERASGRFVAEGRIVVERLLGSAFEVETVLLTEPVFADLEPRLPAAATVLVASHGTIREIAGYDFHRGVLATGVRRPRTSIAGLIPGDGEPVMFVVCPCTTDPVNVGHLVRLGRAFGVRALLLGPGSADPFSRRVLRVSMGHALHLPIVESLDLRADLAALRGASVEAVATVLDADATPLHDSTPPTRVALLFGHEGEGLGREWADHCDHRWTIPMAAGVNSLNVADSAAIVLHWTGLGGVIPENLRARGIGVDPDSGTS